MQTVLTIAGFDPSSGAGVTADLMVFAAHGLFGTACITAQTVQSTLGVRSVEAASARQVTDTLAYLTSDLKPDGIKIGMLAEADTVQAVVRFLRELPGRRDTPVVLDPVVRSSSGRQLLSREGLDAMKHDLLPEVDWVTPNLDELGALLGRTIEPAHTATAANELSEKVRGLRIVVTGGDLPEPDDLLLTPGARPEWIRGSRVETQSTHGTGCSYSSALLSRLVLGDAPENAARSAKEYVREAMRTAHPLGGGRGPLNHLWPLRLSRPDAR